MTADGGHSGTDLYPSTSNAGAESSGQHGCCNDNAAADFSRLSLPPIDAIDMSKHTLWLAVGLVVLDPFYKPVVAVVEYKTRLLSRAVGEGMVFEIYLCFAFLHSVMAFMVFNNALREQPWFDYLQSNTILLLAYLLLLTGLGMKLYTVCLYGWRTIFGELYFKPGAGVCGERNVHEATGDPYYHPNGTASISCLTAISLLRASLAGLMICTLLTVAYISAHQLEQFLLHWDWSTVVQRAKFTKIKVTEIELEGSNDIKSKHNNVCN